MKIQTFHWINVCLFFILWSIPSLLNASDVESYEVRIFHKPYRALTQEGKTKVHSLREGGESSFIMNIGFNFRFGQTGYESIRVSENGFIQFVTHTFKSTHIRCTEEKETDAVVAVCAADLHPLYTSTTKSKIRTGVFGSTPNRVCVVEWAAASFKNASGKGSSGDTLTFQIQLHERGNKIRLHYGSCTFVQTQPHWVVIGILCDNPLQIRALYLPSPDATWKQVKVSDGIAERFACQVNSCPPEGTVIEFSNNRLDGTQVKAHQPLITEAKLPTWLSIVHKVLLVMTEGRMFTSLILT